MVLVGDHKEDIEDDSFVGDFDEFWEGCYLGGRLLEVDGKRCGGGF